MSHKIIEQKLLTLREFQLKYPTSHVGGSIGLAIRGVDLKRNLYNSDLDITIDEIDESSLYSDNISNRSDCNDFDYAVRRDFSDGHYVKIDIRISPEPSFDTIEFNGHFYNVSKLRDILFWKKKYADKGVSKHELDLIAINTGVRPEALYPDGNTFHDNTHDYLPF